MEDVEISGLIQVSGAVKSLSSKKKQRKSRKSQHKRGGILRQREMWNLQNAERSNVGSLAK